jgi:hypothetical protein
MTGNTQTKETTMKTKLYTAKPNLDQCGYVGTREDWFQMLLDPSGPGTDWYGAYCTEYNAEEHLSGEVCMGFTDWANDLLDDSLIEADDDEINKLPRLSDF